MKVNLAKIEHLSTVDYPKKISCVVFFNGCSWKCSHCHNKQTWTDINMVDIEYVKSEIKSCLPFISSVVFSGGEPTNQILPLIELCKYSKNLNLFVGIETNGSNPNALEKLIGIVDRVFLDIKAPLNNNSSYYHATNNINSLKNVTESLNLSLPFEIRILVR